MECILFACPWSGGGVCAQYYHGACGAVLFPGSRNKWINSSRRGVSILLSILLVMGIIALIGGLVLPELGKAFGVIGRNVPVFLEEAAGWLEKTMP